MNPTLDAGCCRLLGVIEAFYITTSLRHVFPETVLRMQIEYDQLKNNGRFTVKDKISSVAQLCSLTLCALIFAIDLHLNRYCGESETQDGEDVTTLTACKATVQVQGEDREDGIMIALRSRAKRISDILDKIDKSPNLLCTWALAFDRAKAIGGGLVTVQLGEELQFCVKIPDRAREWRREVSSINDSMISIKATMMINRTSDKQRSWHNPMIESIALHFSRYGDLQREQLTDMWRLGYSCTIPSTLRGETLVAEQVKLKIEILVLGDIRIANTPVIATTLPVTSTPPTTTTLPMTSSSVFTGLMFGGAKKK
jgi:hypothetical protein